MKLVVNTEKTVCRLGDLFGIFFEDINHAADGGLYAELVRNRSFECCPVDNPDYHGLTAWEAIGDTKWLRFAVGEEAPAFAENPHYLVMEYTGKGRKAGVWNLGFNTGISVEKGKRYYLTIYARGVNRKEKLCIALCAGTGQIYAERELALENTWNKYEWSIEAPVTDAGARLALTLAQAGSVHVAYVSLFPADTFRGRQNGMRKDLAELLEAMHPKFMRFPGGCLVHTGSLNREDRDSLYRWKDTLGEVEHRPARKNRWGYHQTLGLGYYEYFQFCEDIGAKPLPVLPAGYDPHHHCAADGELLGEFVQDALDLVEFANGGSDTRWGKIRCELGHPAPFKLEYLGIGNEEEGEEFYPRYAAIHRALRECFPEIKLIGTSGPFAAGHWYERGWEEARREGADLVDEHFYMAPQWFISNSRRYEDFPGTPPYVFVGEYASKGNTWYHALAEACFMTGLQNSSHAVKLACYAPLFCNVDYQDWKPDLIWYDNHRAAETPNYHVQKLFMENQGDWLLSQKWEDMPEPVFSGGCRLSGGVDLQAEYAKVLYRNIVIVDEDTKETLYQADEICLDDERCGNIPVWLNAENYTIQMEAERLSGRGGFAVHFAVCGNREIFWRLGGSSNKDSALIEVIEGQTAVMTYQTRHIEEHRIYSLRIEIRGRHIETLIDGRREQAAEWKPMRAEAMYASSSMDEKNGDIIIKLVNVLPVRQKLEIVLEGEHSLEGKHPLEGKHLLEGEHLSDGWEGHVLSLAGSGGTDAFGLEQIATKEEQLSVARDAFEWEAAEESVHIIRLRRRRR